MRQTYITNPVEAAIRNVESALQELTDRLDSLPGVGRRGSRLRRAGRSIKRKAGYLVDRVPFERATERATEVAADTGRVVRQNPVKTVLTVAIAGYCIWSLIRYSTHRTAAERRTDASDAEGNRRLKEDISRGAGVRDELSDDEAESPRH